MIMSKTLKNCAKALDNRRCKALDLRRKQGKGPSPRVISGSGIDPYCRRARYTPRRMTAPPKIFSIPKTSLKKIMPEATPVMVMRYW